VYVLTPSAVVNPDGGWVEKKLIKTADGAKEPPSGFGGRKIASIKADQGTEL